MHVAVRGQILRVGYLYPPWAAGIRPVSSDLHHKHFHTQTHPMAPCLSFLRNQFSKVRRIATIL